MTKRWALTTIAFLLATGLVFPASAEPQTTSNPLEGWFAWLDEIWTSLTSFDEVGGTHDPMGRDEMGGIHEPIGSATTMTKAGGSIDPLGRDEATGYIQPNGEPAAATGRAEPVDGDELYPTIEPAG